MTVADSFCGLVEFAPAFAPRPQTSHVLFDFDGTVSLIREGWPEIMVPMFVEMLPALPGEPEAARRKLCFEDIMRLNGKQTIYQMIQLAERIKERGGTPREPLWYKHEYLRRLEERIRHRTAGLRRGEIQADDLLVFGTRALLETLQWRRLTLYLASGTDEQFVKAEADLLDVTRYFGRHIYGAQDDYKQFSKKMVIERILRENKIEEVLLIQSELDRSRIAEMMSVCERNLADFHVVPDTTELIFSGMIVQTMHGVPVESRSPGANHPSSQPGLPNRAPCAAGA